jgi:RNA polymerase sigma factor (TIGR02999 family)
MASVDAGGITQLLDRIRGGDRAALDTLVPLVYSELHRLAADQMHRDRFSITLQPTALIHEAFLRIFGNSVPSFQDRSHFLGIVSRVMRQVLVDHARRRRAHKRGSGLQVSLEGVVEEPSRPAVDLLEMNEVLERLGAEDPRLLTLVEMRFFAGMTAEETAAALGESVNVVRHNLRYALASLRRDLDPARAKK